EADDAFSGDRREAEVTLGQLGDARRGVEIAPLRLQHMHRLLILQDLALHGGDLVLEHAHLLLDLEQDEGGDRAGSDPAEDDETLHAACLPSGPRAGAAVRSAARNCAERARGLARHSASLGRRVPRNSGVKVAAALLPGAVGGAWREPPASRPLRSRRNCFTMRSSSEWKVTTASRPPGRSSFSAAARPRSSSPSSSFT